jgi:hypothetical protein
MAKGFVQALALAQVLALQVQVWEFPWAFPRKFPWAFLQALVQVLEHGRARVQPLPLAAS